MSIPFPGHECRWRIQHQLLLEATETHLDIYMSIFLPPPRLLLLPPHHKTHQETHTIATDPNSLHNLQPSDFFIFYQKSPILKKPKCSTSPPSPLSSWALPSLAPSTDARSTLPAADCKISFSCARHDILLIPKAPTADFGYLLSVLSYGTAQCCATDVLGVADLNCANPPTVPTSAANFSAECADIGQQARCCVLPIVCLNSCPSP